MNEKDTVRRYVAYDEDGTMKLSVKTTLFGGYDREETSEMVYRLSDYYRNRIMKLMDTVAERDREIHRLQHRIHTAEHK